MLKSKPPVRLTAPPQRRLRGRSAAIAAALALVPTVAPASSQGLRILIDASVSERASSVMTAAAWTAFVTAGVGKAAVTLPAATEPSLEACRTAGDDFLLHARFDLRPRLPGLANSSGRVAAQVHLQLVNCVTAETSVDRVLRIDADPDAANEGDYESGAEVTWRRSVPAALKSVALLGRVGRVIRVAPPLAYIDFRGVDLKPGDTLRDFARSDRGAHPSTIALSVTQVFETYVEAIYPAADGEPQPAIGDLVEFEFSRPAASARP